MRLMLAELRDSWRAWLGVSVTLLSATFAIVLSAIVTANGAALLGDHALVHDEASRMEVQAITYLGGMNLALCSMVGLATIGAAVGLVVNSRRGSIARLALAGASPRQLVGNLISQLAVVTLFFSLVGSALALTAYVPAMHYLSHERGMDFPIRPVNLAALVAAWLLCVLVAVVGGFRQGLRASRIPPVEALRQAQGDVRQGRQPGRWVLAALLAVAAVGVWTATLGNLRSDPKQGGTLAMQMPLLVMVLTGCVFVAGRQLFMIGLTRLWTRVLPSRSATWHLARNTALGKGDRLAKSVTPAMFTVGLLLGLMTMGATMEATFRAMGNGDELSHGSMASLLGLMGLPLLVAMSGSVSTLVMMSSQREAELALDGIIGATPRQQVAVPALEAAVVTGTAVLLAVGMNLPSLVLMDRALSIVFLRHVMAFGWTTLVGVTAVVAVVVAAAIVTPLLPSLRQPPNRVVARLVAE